MLQNFEHPSDSAFSMTPQLSTKASNEEALV